MSPTRSWAGLLGWLALSYAAAARGALASAQAGTFYLRLARPAGAPPPGVFDLLVVATLAAFWRIHRAAALPLVPYLAGIAFATALTWAVWQAHPGLLR